MTTPSPDPGDVTEREADWRRWKRGERLEVLAKERGVTRERMRHQLMRTDEGMDTLALLARAERAEAERDAMADSFRSASKYLAIETRHAEQAEAERDAAYAAGQEDMRERVIGETSATRAEDATRDRIRALPIKPYS